MWQDRITYQELRFQNTLRHLAFLIILFFFVFILRLFSLNVIKGTKYHRMSENNRIKSFFEPAPRGILCDRVGRILAENVPTFSVLFSPESLSTNEGRDAIERLIKILSLDYGATFSRLNASLKSRLSSVCISENVPVEKIFYLSEQKMSFPGMKIQVQPVRYYPKYDFASHLIGYVGEINEEELSGLSHLGYKLGDRIGKIGVEKIYDGTLKGLDGDEEIEVDAGGREVRLVSRRASRMGRGLILTLDERIQKASEDALGSKKGAVCVLDPATGEILALVSKPSFDPNVFAGESSFSGYDELFKNPDLPMFNRAIQSQYAPGSLFKIITAVAALEEKVIGEDDTFFCPGSFTVGRGGRKKEFRCWKKEGHGNMNITHGLANSCDVFFYKLGLKTGADNIAKYARMFGLSYRTGICLPYEEKGLIPSPAWKHNKFNETWYPGDTVNMSIGQGYILVTPLQVACMLSMVATRGILYKPFIVKHVISTEGEILETFRPEVIRKINLSEKTWSVLTDGLREAVLSGTCQRLNFRDLAVIAKTGTAQNPHGEDHAWFICSAPAENPRIVVVVFVEHGGHGASSASPVARSIIEQAFRLRGERIAETFVAED